jgi:hypothetical protein
VGSIFLGDVTRYGGQGSVCVVVNMLERQPSTRTFEIIATKLVTFQRSIYLRTL